MALYWFLLDCCHKIATVLCYDMCPFNCHFTVYQHADVPHQQMVWLGTVSCGRSQWKSCQVRPDTLTRSNCSQLIQSSKRSAALALHEPCGCACGDALLLCTAKWLRSAHSGVEWLPPGLRVWVTWLLGCLCCALQEYSVSSAAWSTSKSAATWRIVAV